MEKKRKAESSDADGQSRKAKKGWQVQRKSQQTNSAGLVDTSRYQIEAGDSGIWATCELGREAKCVSELRDLLEQNASKPSDESQGLEPSKSEDAEAGASGDIEAELEREVAAIKQNRETNFKNIKIDLPCLLYMKTPEWVDPVELVHRICDTSLTNATRKRGRWIKRLIPMTLMGKATEASFKETAEKVLAPHFHGEDVKAKKFAIRPSIRAHNTFKREWVIKTLADMVGPPHTVDLKNYDALVIAEIYKNVCGFSVVGGDFEKLKRYNLSELYHPVEKVTED